MSREDGDIYLGIGEKNPNFMKPDHPDNPVKPDDGGNTPIHKDSRVIVGLAIAILIVSGLICCLMYKKKKDKMSKPV